MVIASLAWTFKAWFGLTLPRSQDRHEIVRMEFRRFLNAIVLIPAQVLRTGRRLVVRLLAYGNLIRLLFRSMQGGFGRRHPGNRRGPDKIYAPHFPGWHIPI